jgi:BTB/POZ domain-containing protein KCTD9
MSAERASRLSYEDSCRFLQRHNYLGGETAGAIPPMPEHRPQFDDGEPLGVGFYRTWIGLGRREVYPIGWVEVTELALENLTLPRTFFGRSEVGPISFRNTDLSESTLCWNDFIEVDFTDADLSESDLRASIFTRVTFVRTNLRNADLRGSDFEACDFADAEMVGVKLTRKQGKRIHLSDEQSKVVEWHDSDGEEPPGG